MSAPAERPWEPSPLSPYTLAASTPERPALGLREAALLGNAGAFALLGIATTSAYWARNNRYRDNGEERILYDLAMSSYSFFALGGFPLATLSSALTLVAAVRVANIRHDSPLLAVAGLGAVAFSIVAVLPIAVAVDEPIVHVAAAGLALTGTMLSVAQLVLNSETDRGQTQTQWSVAPLRGGGQASLSVSF